MASVSEGKMKVVLPVEKEKEFISYFNTNNSMSNNRKKCYLLINGYYRWQSKDGKLVLLTIPFDCEYGVFDACYSSIEEESETFISLQAMIRKCNVKELYIISENEMEDFREKMVYSKDSNEDTSAPIKVNYERQEIWSNVNEYDFCLDEFPLEEQYKTKHIRN